MKNPNGSLKVDTYAETDSNFSYNNDSIIKILGYNPEYIIDLSKAIEYVLSCQRLNISDKIQTGKWLTERQTFLEGFNGRPEKLLDVSSFWCVLSNIFMIGVENFFDKDLLIKLIFEYQDDE